MVLPVVLDQLVVAELFASELRQGGDSVSGSLDAPVKASLRRPPRGGRNGLVSFCFLTFRGEADGGPQADRPWLKQVGLRFSVEVTTHVPLAVAEGAQMLT